jgi:excinuclease UvrABC helicase subunit UvrB
VDERVDDDDDAWQFLQFYPYVRMMNARARAEKVLRAGKFQEARDLAQQGIEDIHGFWMEQEDMEEAENSSEIAILQELIKEVDQHRPVSPEERLQAELASAIRDENYEKAAKLRDALRDLG